jgi:hypothetical protein
LSLSLYIFSARRWQKTSTSPAIERQRNEKTIKGSKHEKSSENLRINLTLHGQPAIQAKELKQSGFVRNNADLVSQAITVLYQQVIDQRLKVFRLRTLEGNEEDNDL